MKLGLVVAAALTLAAATSPSQPKPAVILAAGDIASCTSTGDEATARILARTPGTVLTLGDHVYPDGSLDAFRRCYAPTWGRFRSRTRPAPGNHDYEVSGAAGYFDYFGARAGRRGQGWYSFDLGAWHVIALNSNCGAVGGCATGSPQQRWLAADLAAHPSRCALAYWHHARFSSGPHGSDTATTDLWRTLYAAGADVVLVGHDHDYERFAPQTADGRLDSARGIREFVVGTGGRSHYTFERSAENSRVRNNTAYGVLKLTLGPDSYTWRFLPVAGRRFGDHGSWRCR